MIDNNNILDRIRKVKALYDGAKTDGERAAALSKLNELLEKHDLKEDQIVEPKLIDLSIKYKNDNERRLINQVYWFVVGFDQSRAAYWDCTSNRTHSLRFRVTKEEKDQINRMYSQIKKEFQRQVALSLESTLLAVMIKANILQPNSDDNDEDLSEEELLKWMNAYATSKHVNLNLHDQLKA